MAILNIVKYPNELLHKKSKDVENFDEKLKDLVSDMFKTMKKFNGIGLAAVQVGILKKVIVIDVDDADTDICLDGNCKKQQFKSEIINPKITSYSEDKSVMTEGCLSVDNRVCNVERPNKITVEYYTLDGKKHTVEASGLLAKCFQHEIDHINGITIIDRENNQQI